MHVSETARHAGDVVVSETLRRFDWFMTNWHSGTGRPSKGPRDAMMVRPRQELGDLIRARAEEAGMSITDFIANSMAEVLGRPELAPEETRIDKTQRELPLPQTA